MASSSDDSERLGGRKKSRSRSASPTSGTNDVGGPVAKKFRPETLPPIVNGVISASHTPIVDGGRQVAVEDKEANLSMFFDDIDDLRQIPEYKIQPYLQNAIADRLVSEETLRNAVFTDLSENHEITFPESCYVEKRRNILRIPSLRYVKCKRYVETDLSSLMAEYGKSIDIETPSMRRIMRGLPVTTTSKPDLVPLDVRGKSGAQLRMGEFKNNSVYNEKQARAQCVMYLIGLMYWLRAEQGKAVEAVYGFYFCGRRCEGFFSNRYSVGLIKLSAPQHLGDEIKAEYFKVDGPSNDLLPLRFLIHFLKKGKRWSLDPRRDMNDPKRRIPALYALPTTLWEDNGNNRKLVLNSTLAIVFRVSAEGLKNLLNYEGYFSRSIKEEREWYHFLWDVEKFVETFQDPNVSFYFKIRTRDTSFQPSPMKSMNKAWGNFTPNSYENEEKEIACRSITSTYACIDVDRNDGTVHRLLLTQVFEEFGMSLMRDRGRPLTDFADSRQLPRSKLLREFQNVVHTATYLSKTLPHGDVLPHNIVYDQSTEVLSLIDIDEGVPIGQPLLTRKNEYKGEGDDWYTGLSYPNFYVEDPLRYTQSQLIASFLYLLRIVGEELPEGETLSDYVNLTNDLNLNASKLGKILADLDSRKVDFSKVVQETRSDANGLLDSSYLLMFKIMNYNQSLGD
eukprot:CAMPEP_0113470632 /NCGR_PEP_ID=MMETSP0014_2-20120614/16547_1 /TAXON_ID=2857 /ORGANISM="Nitzschia sp." /LENGTH=677 /DNA_ID=CAMNT_0000363211 /DNA_START=126 /DNA_END=2159 /DNA_ORIENTATION=- /assembly_acc=CAM_ASM_000159